MRTLRSMVYVVALAVALTGSGLAYAEQGNTGRSEKGEGKGRGEMMEKRGGGMGQKLGLTDEQKQKMKAFREEHKAKMQALREKMKSKREELRSVLDTQPVNRAKAQSLTNEIKSIFGEIADLRLEMVFKANEVLTPEQLKKMKEFRKEHKGEWKGNGEGKNKRWNKEGGAREHFKKRHSEGGEGQGDSDEGEGPELEDGSEGM